MLLLPFFRFLREPVRSRTHTTVEQAGPDAPPEPEYPSRKKPRRPFLFWVRISIVLMMLWLVAVMIYHTQKPLPPGISYESPVYQTGKIAFWADLTYPGPDGKPVHEQTINRRIGEIIDESREFLVMDMFLFNQYKHKDQRFPPISEELTDRLISHKAKYPEIDIVFITDEVNTNYGSAPNPLLERMKKAGIAVVITNVDPLRDSTPVYSAIWRTFIQWFGQSGSGKLPNLMADDGPSITLRSYLKLLNVKANHRKLIVSEKTALISSANIHDASAYHSNIAIEAGGEMISDVLAAEQAAVNLGSKLKLPEYRPSTAGQPVPDTASGKQKETDVSPKTAGQPVDVRYLTEGKIYWHTLEAVRQAEKGDVLWMGMFYLAEDEVMKELIKAAARGAEVRLILDPNQNAFGRDKIGIPNRPAAAELVRDSGGSVEVRWYNTGEEQYHTKIMYIAKPSGKSVLIGGSTNFTPRNLKNYNLENNIWAALPTQHPVKQQLDDYFDRLWFNRGAEFTLDFSAYEENTTWLKDIAFRLQKLLGFTTF